MISGFAQKHLVAICGYVAILGLWQLLLVRFSSLTWARPQAKWSPSVTAGGPRIEPAPTVEDWRGTTTPGSCFGEYLMYLSFNEMFKKSDLPDHLWDVFLMQNGDLAHNLDTQELSLLLRLSQTCSYPRSLAPYAVDRPLARDSRNPRVEPGSEMRWLFSKAESFGSYTNWGNDDSDAFEWIFPTPLA